MPDRNPLESAIEKAENSAAFTAEEVRALKEMANAWHGLEAFGRVASVVRKILAYVGWMIAGYLAIKLMLSDWLKALAK